MIRRSDAANYAKASFYTAFNDIDVFVEDTANESRKVYVEILSRVFGNKVLISQIFPIGSKPTVLKRCRADQEDRERPALYIVDGDYDCFSDGSAEVLQRLYRLRRYCIENYLIDPVAVIDVLNDDSLDLDETGIREELDLHSWLKCIAPSLSMIVLALIASNKKQCGMSTVRLDLNQIQGEFRDHIDPEKSIVLVEGYRLAIDGRWGIGSYEALVAELKASIGERDEDIFLRYMSAKAVLMPLLRSRIKRRAGVDVDYPRFRVRLARRCDVSEFADMPAAVS